MKMIGVGWGEPLHTPAVSVTSRGASSPHVPNSCSHRTRPCPTSEAMGHWDEGEVMPPRIEEDGQEVVVSYSPSPARPFVRLMDWLCQPNKAQVQERWGLNLQTSSPQTETAPAGG